MKIEQSLGQKQELKLSQDLRQAINILNGWIDKNESGGDKGKKYTNVFAVITDFELSDTFDDDTEPSDETADNNAAFRAMNGDENTPFNGGRG